MPKYTYIKKVLIIGSGPIIIGQACEFDYSGVQACKALREEGIYVILVNSNPATIMTDPKIANSTYIEPIKWEILSKIIEKERPDALLPTMGGQTALNCALELYKYGVLKIFNVKIIGVNISTIKKAENRNKFINLMNKIGLESPKSVIIRYIKDIYEIKTKIGFPCIIRPSYTMGGFGGGIANNFDELKKICIRGLNIAPTKELLIDEYLIGWKEYEMELLRDKKGNCIIICSIENFDTLGVHTGDSITVAPAQTLTDKEYQIMRNASITVLKEIGIDSGGSNVQFGIHPKTGKMVVIEMNPRVSRSSALASKATGFPIAKIAAKLAIGYTLDELKNDITKGKIPASFEPSIDYVVTKIPIFNFEKFPKANDRLTTEMKSVGEVMAIGRSFKESLQKALRSLDIGINGLDNKILNFNKNSLNIIKKELINPGYERIFYIADAFRVGLTIKEIFNYTKIDIWFLSQIKELINIENIFLNKNINNINYEYLYLLKKQGFSDKRIANLLKVKEKNIRDLRKKLKIHPVYKRVDTCSAEFTTSTDYMYSTYDNECEANIKNTSDKIIIIGSGPNKIGQGIEFDYCCVHAAIAMRENGFQTIMINCNPETVSTDYDISDRLYFEPITLEDILEIIRKENPKGVIIQFGGQTPLKIIKNNQEIPIIGTNKLAIDIAEDREKFKKLIKKIKLLQPENEIAFNLEDALIKAKNIGYPLIVRPSYVIGGRAMEIVYNVKELEKYIKQAFKLSNNNSILLDKYINKAIEIDIDALSDGKEVLICGIMQHIEQAGIHSGDSACSLPPFYLDIKIQNEIKKQIKKIAIELKIVGLMNCQLACKNNKIYILEVNPRASRTIPFVSKCIGFSLAKIAANCMIGKSLNYKKILKNIKPKFYGVKEAVLPFNKFIGVDPVLSPEMKSTGEVMGIGSNFSEAFYKAQLSIGMPIIKIKEKKQLIAFISVSNKDKNKISKIAKNLINLGFNLMATIGTANIILKNGILVKSISKKNIIFIFKKYKINYVINTINKKNNLIKKNYLIRNTAIIKKVPYTTTIAGAYAICMALKYCNKINKVRKIQDMHLGVI